MGSPTLSSNQASPIEPHYSEYLVFEGISVDEFTSKQYYLDAHVAYRRACMNAIEYFKKFCSDSNL